MTAQIDDQLIWGRTSYVILAYTLDDNGTLFRPLDYRLFPVKMHTACYRGYYCRYKILRGSLVLSELSINTAEDKYPMINGIEAVLREDGECARYEKLNMRLPVSGVIRIAKDFIPDRHRHMGFQEVTTYKTVRQLYLEHGKVVRDEDLSAAVEELREMHEYVKNWRERNWITEEWETQLGKSYAFVDDDIRDMFNRWLKPISAKGVAQVLGAIEDAQKAPNWFIVNYRDYYERAHDYEYEYNFLTFLGCPERVVDFLRGLAEYGYTERKIVLTFIETLRTTIIGNLWSETLHVINGRLYAKENIDKVLNARVKNLLFGVTLEKWMA